MTEHLTTRPKFNGSQAVLIGVVLVHAVNTQRGIAVAFPTTAEIQFVINATYAEAAGDGQPQRIIFTVTGIGNTNVAQQFRTESARCPQSIDAQSIVATVLVCPFVVGDDSRRQSVQLKIHHPVCPDDHCRTFRLTEFCHDTRQRIRAAIEVIRVELHYKTTATCIAYGYIPTSTNT